MVAPIRYGLEDQSCLPSQMSFFFSISQLHNERVIAVLPVSFRSSSKKNRRDLADRMKFVPSDLRVAESVCVCYWQADPSKSQQGWKSGRCLKVEIIAAKGPMAVTSTGASIFQVNESKL